MSVYQVAKKIMEFLEENPAYYSAKDLSIALNISIHKIYGACNILRYETEIFGVRTDQKKFYYFSKKTLDKVNRMCYTYYRKRG